MENSYPATGMDELREPARPENLKILCILSFVACGLMMLVYLTGSFSMAIDDNLRHQIWNDAVKDYPQLENIDPVEFFDSVGMISLYCLIANVFSLIGVIMMWNLEKIGFFVYMVAELVTHLFNFQMPDMGERSNTGTVFTIIVDLVFIGLYFSQLKYMKGKKKAATGPELNDRDVHS